MVAAAGIAFALLYPLSMVLREAIVDEQGAFDLTPILRIFRFPVPRQVVANTIVMGITSGFLATGLGFAFALATTRAVRGPLRTDRKSVV